MAIIDLRKNFGQTKDGNQRPALLKPCFRCSCLSWVSLKLAYRVGGVLPKYPPHKKKKTIESSNVRTLALQVTSSTLLEVNHARAGG